MGVFTKRLARIGASANATAAILMVRMPNPLSMASRVGTLTSGGHSDKDRLVSTAALSSRCVR